MDDLDLADLRETHVAGASYNPKACRSCGEPWPCRAVRLVEENARLRAALQELYEAAHDHLNAPDDAGWISEGTPRLNAALGAAFKALHER